MNIKLIHTYRSGTLYLNLTNLIALNYLSAFPPGAVYAGPASCGSIASTLKSRQIVPYVILSNKK